MSILALDGGMPELSGVGELPAWPRRRPGDDEALLDVLRSGKWGSTAGTVVAEFEREFAEYHETAHGTALANGTLALVVALRACGVGVGDEVVVPPYTFIATASAALFVGAVPVFADVDPDTHLLDPYAVEAAITSRTRAIIPVHLGGRAADMEAFARLGREHDLAVIEDCAQAVGTRYRGTPVGTLGNVGTFSFQSSKNMTAGEGGLVVTNDDELGSRLYSLVNVGRVRDGGWYQHESVGYNLRMTEFQGALLRRQLQQHPADQEVRARNAEILRTELDGVDGIQLTPKDPDLTTHGHHLFMLRLPALGEHDLRDTAVAALAAEGVEAATGYVPLHRNRAVEAEARQLAERLGQARPEPVCPATDLVSRDTVWLPQRMLLGSEEQTQAIARAVRKVVTAGDALRAHQGKDAA